MHYYLNLIKQIKKGFNNTENILTSSCLIFNRIGEKMSGPAEGKKLLRNVRVYIHRKGKSLATVTHIDIEGDIKKIINPGEITFIKGKEVGVFIALKKPMIKRAEELL